MRTILTRSRELRETAAVLLTYLSAAPENESIPATQTVSVGTDTDETMYAVPSGAVRDIFPQDAALPAAHELQRQYSTSPAPSYGGLDFGEAAQKSASAERLTGFADTEAPMDPAAVQRSVFSASAETQRTMDDISEFFRRDSRRYDNGFAGGNGR